MNSLSNLSYLGRGGHGGGHHHGGGGRGGHGGGWGGGWSPTIYVEEPLIVWPIDPMSEVYSDDQGEEALAGLGAFSNIPTWMLVAGAIALFYLAKKK